MRIRELCLWTLEAERFIKSDLDVLHRRSGNLRSGLLLRSARLIPLVREAPSLEQRGRAGSKGKRKLVAIVVLGFFLQVAVSLLVIFAVIVPTIRPLAAPLGPATTVEDAKAVAQEFLRQVAGKNFNLACTQAILPGLVNPCMEDLEQRDFEEVYQAGDKIVVTRAEVTSNTAVVNGRDTRPALSVDFRLTLKITEGRWLVASVNGKKIVGSP